MAELLAPAGGIDSAKAAFIMGANACYIGGRWSARAFAQNFTLSDMEEITKFAHLRGGKIYVALNTMVHESEMDEVLAYAGQVRQTGADAIIVADVGLACQLHSIYPDISLHASTQMGVHDADGARMAMAAGCVRVVAARECDLAQLKDISLTGVELEVFVHGALCSSISGSCLMSYVMGGRSGNRGECAQPCRREYKLEDSQAAYHLSTADLCAIRHLKDLIDVGVCSLKLEGRMKRLPYVCVVVECYRRALDAIQSGEKVDFDALEDSLKRIYNRGGFTQGYIYGNRNVTYPSRQNHMGVLAGKVKLIKQGVALIDATLPLKKGDGVEFFAEKSHGGGTLGFVRETAAGLAIPVPTGVQIGDNVCLTTDSSQIERAQQLVEKDDFYIDASARLTIKTGEKILLELWAKEYLVTVKGGIVQPAQKESNQERWIHCIKKMGGTPFRLTRVDLCADYDAFAAISEINALRREAVEKMIHLLASPVRTNNSPPNPAQSVQTKKCTRYTAAQVRTIEQALAAWSISGVRVYFHPESISGKLLETLKLNKAGELWLVIPPFLSLEEKDSLRSLIGQFPNLFDGALAGNIGQVLFARDLFPNVMGDYWLNTANRYSLNFWQQMGLSNVTMTVEKGELASETEVIVGGRLALMNLRHIPAKNQSTLTDERGRRFTLFNTGSGLMQLVSSENLHFSSPILSRRLIFWNESSQSIISALSSR